MKMISGRLLSAQSCSVSSWFRPMAACQSMSCWAWRKATRVLPSLTFRMAEYTW
jgi:hypothetical protein